MTNIAWAHLPNAKHIDAVLADVRKRPAAWVAVAQDAARDAARYAAQDAAWNEVVCAARNVAMNVAANKARYAAWDALYALVAWDSSADLLDCTPDVLRAMIDLAEPPVCYQAVLLLPYAIVRSNDK